MKPGPRSNPTPLKILRGNPGHQRINKQEPNPAPGCPKCPRWLLPEAKREWRRKAPELALMGVLTQIDGSALAAYCQVWAHWRECEEFITENGRVIVLRDDKGVVKWTQETPQARLALKYLEKIRQFASEFGLTPAARVGLPASPKKNSLRQELLA